MRAFFQELGAEVAWDDATSTVTAVRSGTTIRLRIGTAQAWVNDEPRPLTVAPRIISNSTFIPLRFVGEALGAEVVWDNGIITVMSRPGDSAWTGEYFNNPNFSGSPALVRKDPAINFAWGMAGPTTAINPDNFSVRWTRTLTFASGLYRFHWDSYDAVILSVDGRRVMEEWGDWGPLVLGGERTAFLQLDAGQHTLQVQYRDDTRDATAKLTWEAVPVSEGPGDTLGGLGAEADQIKVLVLNFDPTVPSEGGKRLHELGFRWNDPRKLAEGYTADLREVSGGRVDFEVVDWQDINAFPPGDGTFTYTADGFAETYRKARAARPNGDFWLYDGWSKELGQIDYRKIIDDYDLAARIKSGEVDEVWLFTSPMIPALRETTMAGPGAYWCNSTPVLEVDSGRPFVISTFNYEREVDCMLEDFGHRAESIMWHVFGQWRTAGYWQDAGKIDYSDLNKWERFTLYDKIAPGHAACGNVHFAPNSEYDYYWGSTKPVPTTYVDWLDYPSLTGEQVVADCSAWGNGNMELHHKWWLGLMPKVDGVDEQGYPNNWWHYLVHFGRK
jgi:hypothetical protein